MAAFFINLIIIKINLKLFNNIFYFYAGKKLLYKYLFMKKIFISLFIISVFTVNVKAQDIAEPDFIGEVVLVKGDNTSVPLEKTTSQGRAVASTGLLLTGIGKVRSQLQIDGCCANVKVKSNEPISLIIKGIDNATDPMSIVKIFKFEQKKKYRRAELSSVNNFGGSKSNNMDYVSFTGKKYGTSSYLLKVAALQPGEYGITISNPNNLDEKATIVSTFAVN